MDDMLVPTVYPLHVYLKNPCPTVPERQGTRKVGRRQRKEAK